MLYICDICALISVVLMIGWEGMLGSVIIRGPSYGRQGGQDMSRECRGQEVGKLLVHYRVFFGRLKRRLLRQTTYTKLEWSVFCYSCCVLFVYFLLLYHGPHLFHTTCGLRGRKMCASKCAPHETENVQSRHIKPPRQSYHHLRVKA